MRFGHNFSSFATVAVAFVVVGCAAPAPTVNVPAPIVNVPAPIVNVPAPIVNVPAPVMVQVPETAPTSQEVSACCDCATPYPSIAITQATSHACEGNCSDFPVSYRVQVPETDSRVRNIDRTLVTSGKAQISKIANCGCNGGSCKTKETK